jgi:hypothetical protein
LGIGGVILLRKRTKSLCAQDRLSHKELDPHWLSPRGRVAASSLPASSKLFKREQIDHSLGFNASLAQTHHMLSHVWHQWVIRFRKAECSARVRESCGHNRDLIWFEGSSF